MLLEAKIKLKASIIITEESEHEVEKLIIDIQPSPTESFNIENNHSMPMKDVQHANDYSLQIATET